MYRRILIPLDGSPMAEQALPHAIAQADRFQAELILLRVLEPFAHARGISQRGLKRIEHESRAWAGDYLDRVAADVRQLGIPVQTVIIDGPSHVEIPHFAESNQVDLIVLSARGQSGLSRWMMGSVADRVVRGARTPVLLVRGAEEGA